MLLIWLKFSICVAIIFFSGKRVAKYGDIIAEKTGLGGVGDFCGARKNLSSLRSKINSIFRVIGPHFSYFSFCAKKLYGKATMNNLPYDTLQFFRFPLSLISGKIGIVLHSFFSSHRRFLCSELIATGFYKEGDYLFVKPTENVLPADFDNTELFEEVKDIWLSVS